MIEKYYLNISKVDEIQSNITKEWILRLYENMITYRYENRINESNAYFNTLYYSGYLENIREEKIKAVL